MRTSWPAANAAQSNTRSVTSSSPAIAGSKSMPLSYTAGRMAHGARRQIAVERRRDDADERLAGRLDVQRAAIPRDQPVARLLLQRRRGIHQGRRVGVMAGRDGAQIGTQVAHHALDHRATQSVGRRQRDTAGDRQAAGAHRIPPSRLPPDGSVRNLGQGADRGSAEADQRGGVIGGVALEIAPKPPLGRSARQGVVRPGEMIEADPLRGRPPSAVRDRLALGEPRRASGSAASRQQALVLLHPRHMGIAEHRGAVGRQARAPRSRSARRSSPSDAAGRRSGRG